jgi:hypothetical protein
LKKQKSNIICYKKCENFQNNLNRLFMLFYLLNLSTPLNIRNFRANEHAHMVIVSNIGNILTTSQWVEVDGLVSIL